MSALQIHTYSVSIILISWIARWWFSQWPLNFKGFSYSVNLVWKFAILVNHYPYKIIFCLISSSFHYLFTSSAGYRHIRCMVIGVLIWMWWMIRNKLVIERKTLPRPTDVIYKLCGFFQLWELPSRSQEHASIDTITGGFIPPVVRLAPPLPPPLPKPD